MLQAATAAAMYGSECLQSHEHQNLKPGMSPVKHVSQRASSEGQRTKNNVVSFRTAAKVRVPYLAVMVLAWQETVRDPVLRDFHLAIVTVLFVDYSLSL